MELQSASASRRRPASVGSGPVLDSASDQARPASMEALMQADDLKACWPTITRHRTITNRTGNNAHNAQ
ncbi:MAG: hypothetical protein R2857_07785 [Vampirovibrionales bacterium]